MSRFDEILKNSKIGIKSKNQVYFDEKLNFKVIIEVAPNTANMMEISNYLKNIKFITVGTFGEKIETTRKETLLQNGIIPTVGVEDHLLFSRFYHGNIPEPQIVENSIILEFEESIDIGRKRASSADLQMTLTVQMMNDISEVEEEDYINEDEVSAVNLVKDLKSISLLLGTNATKDTNTFFQKTANFIAKIGPMLKCTLDVKNISISNSFITLVVETEGDVAVQINEMQLDIPDSLVTAKYTLPVHIGSKDVYNFLISVNLFQSLNGLKYGKPIGVSALEESDTLRRSLSVIFKYKPNNDMSEMTSSFNARLAESVYDGLISKQKISCNHGRLFESSLKPLDESNFMGLQVSLTVIGKVRLQNVFGVQIMVTNTGRKLRNLRIEIPKQNPRSIDDEVICQQPVLTMTFEEFVALYSSSTGGDSIICLEQSEKLPKLEPNTCRFVLLHYIVIQGKSNYLPPFIILDVDTGEEFEIKNSLTIYVE